MRNAIVAGKPLVAHAISNLAGQFLSVDDRFCEIVGRSRTEVLKCDILDLTAEPFKPFNATKLNSLRENGEPFSIDKIYIRGDGTLQAVKNSVSLLIDENRGLLLAATVTAVPKAFDLVEIVQLARTLLIQQQSRLALGGSVNDANWRLLLAAYIAEAEGTHGWAFDLSRHAGGNMQENLFGIWNLVQQGVLVVDGKPNSLESASVQLAPNYTDILESYFHLILSGSENGSALRPQMSNVMTAEDLGWRSAYIAGANAACEAVFIHLPASVADSINAWLLRDLPAWHSGPPPSPFHEPPL